MIEFQRIQKKYSSNRLEKEALKCVDGSVTCGEVVALYGPSGSGKSTLLKICGLLDNDYKGRVIIGDSAITNTAEYSLAIRRENVGFIMPGFDLLSAYTVSENVEFPLLLNNVSTKKRAVWIDEMLERLELGQYANCRSDKLAIEIKQRVLVARAFIHRPLAVVFDEPQPRLGKVEMLGLMAIIKQCANEFGTAVLAATTQASVAEACDRIIYLRNGHIVEHVPASFIRRRVSAEDLPWPH